MAEWAPLACTILGWTFTVMGLLGMAICVISKEKPAASPLFWGDVLLAYQGLLLLAMRG